MIIAGATALPAEVQAWFEAYATAGGAVIVVDSAGRHRRSDVGRDH